MQRPLCSFYGMIDMTAINVLIVGKAKNHQWNQPEKPSTSIIFRRIKIGIGITSVGFSFEELEVSEHRYSKCISRRGLSCVEQESVRVKWRFYSAKMENMLDLWTFCGQESIKSML